MDGGYMGSSNNNNNNNEIKQSSSTSSSSVWEIIEEEEEDERDQKRRLGSIREEVEVEAEAEEENIDDDEILRRSSIISHGIFNRGDDDDDDCCCWVYVGVGSSGTEDESSSVDALSWVLQNANTITSTSTNTTIGVCLVHVFPEVHHIPSPLGKLPKSQVSPEQVETYMAQERAKRRDHLHKFLDMCTASNSKVVKVDTVLIESDMVAKAFLDLIPVLNIRKLVLGTTKSTLTRKWRSRRGSCVVDQILQNAPESCEVNIICQGKQVLMNNDQMISAGSASPSPSPSPSPRRAQGDDHRSTKQLQPTVHGGNANESESFACMCFKSPRVT